MIRTLPSLTMGYDDVGSGLPVVMLHGFPFDRSLWRHQRVALSPQYRCITPDLRGFGESTLGSPVASAGSVDRYADDVIELLDALGIADAVICGLSMGGYIAMALWRRHPSRVRALIFCDTRASGDTDEAKAKRNALITFTRESGAAAVAEKQIAGLLGETTRARRPEVEAKVLAMMSRQPVEGIVAALEALRDRPDSRSTFGSITVPTLIVVGEQDTLTPPADAQTMLELLPPSTSARLEHIPDAGHVSCLERPAAVTHAMGDFLVTIPLDVD